MKNYTKINSGQAYDTIGNNIEVQLKSNDTFEIRFIRTPHTEVSYTTYALQLGKNIPRLNGCEFINAETRRGLKAILETHLDRDFLPREIRVIKPNLASDNWGVFFISYKINSAHTP